jgi:hypothetical protein
MKAKEYELMVHAVENGVSLGWQHAHKHVRKPKPEDVQARIVEEVLNSICEWFAFEYPEVPDAGE